MKPWTPSHQLFAVPTPAVRKSAGRMEAADADAISGGSIRGRAALQMECEGFSRHTVINFSSAFGFEAGGGEGGGPAGGTGQPGSN